MAQATTGSSPVPFFLFYTAFNGGRIEKGESMPTINQLVRQGRQSSVKKSTAPALGKGMNSLIVMIMIRAILRLAVHTAQSASTIMSWANRGICIETSKIDHFASKIMDLKENRKKNFFEFDKNLYLPHILC